MATAVQKVCDKYADDLAFVVSDANEHLSVRDRISHYEFTSAGSYNLSSKGGQLLGGAEKLQPRNDAMTLGKVLGDRMQHLDEFLRELLIAFTDAVRDENDLASQS